MDNASSYKGTTHETVTEASLQSPPIHGENICENGVESSSTLTPSTILASDNYKQKVNKKKQYAPSDLKLHPLPSPKEIRDSIPPEGISITELVSKIFIDDTNAPTFVSFLNVIGTLTPDLRVIRRPEMPPPKIFENILHEAKRPTPPKPVLDEAFDESYQISSEILHPETTEVSFSELQGIVRGASKILPPAFYRIHHENSATLSKHVTLDTHTKRRECPRLGLKPGNAFQALGTFQVRDFTKERIERHLVWNKKEDPSSHVSVFNNIRDANRRIKHHSDRSQQIGERIFCAQISTEGLTAATIKAEVRECVKTITKHKSGKQTENTTYVSRNIRIPIWVRQNPSLNRGVPVMLEDLIASGVEIWMSISEIRVSDMRCSASRGHSYEWLALGKISSSSILHIWPYDGKTLHKKEPSYTVYSINSAQPWIFSWEREMWVLNFKKAHMARLQRTQRIRAGRIRAGRRHVEQNENRTSGELQAHSDKDYEQHAEPNMSDDNGEAQEHSEKHDERAEKLDELQNHPPYCPKCGQRLPAPASGSALVRGLIDSDGVRILSPLA